MQTSYFNVYLMKYSGFAPWETPIFPRPNQLETKIWVNPLSENLQSATTAVLPLANLLVEHVFAEVFKVRPMKIRNFGEVFEVRPIKIKNFSG